MHVSDSRYIHRCSYRMTDLFTIPAGQYECHRASGFRSRGSLMPVACIGFRLVISSL